MHTSLIYLGRRGAGGIISLELARRLARHIQVSVTISSFAEQKELWRATPLPLLEADTYQSAASALFSLASRRQINRLAEKINAQKADALLFPMFHPWNFFLQQRLKHIPAIVFVHDPQPHPDLSGWLFGRLEQKSLYHAQRCILLSERLLPVLIRRGIPRDKIDIIHLGPLKFNAPAQKKQTNLPRILFIGRIAPYKGLGILLEAIQTVQKRKPCSFSVVGEGSLAPYRKKLRKLKNVEIINRWIPDAEIGRYFQESDLLVLPYTSASQSGIIPIAATFGLPVIATRTGGLLEQIEAGFSGWLVPPNDAGALAAVIEEALAHPEEARCRGEALRQVYETRFSWEGSAQKLLKSLERAQQAGGRV